MAPPPAPATPNPHRFAPSKQSKPPVSLSARHQTPQSTSSRQFASTPRFSFGSTQRAQIPVSTAGTSHSSSPLVPRQPPRFPLSNSVRKKDDIEDVGSDEDAENHNPRVSNPELHKTGETIEDPPSTPLPHKRRRLNDAISISSSPSPSPPHGSSSPQQPHISSPQTNPSSPPTTHTHTQPFILSPKRPPSTPSTFPTSSHHRPPFVLPPRSPSPPAQNTHPIFSPHRRGGPKFIPGGMASLVRDWVVEIAGSTPATRDGEWDLRFRVGEIGGGERVSLVEEAGGGDDGIGAEEGKRRWMLAAGNGNGEVRRGMMVGIRRPVWEVEVEGGMWGVGVDWGVLDG